MKNLNITVRQRTDAVNDIPQNFSMQAMLLKKIAPRGAGLNPALDSQVRPLSRGVWLLFADRPMKAPSDWSTGQALDQGFHTQTPQGILIYT